MISDYYTETVKIVTMTPPADGSTVVASESCATEIAALNPINGREQFAAGREFPLADYKAFCSSTVDVDEANELRHGSDKYNVVFVKNTLNRGHHKVILLRRNHG